ncbi:gephyrin-like molybdotransferase Glp [Thermodesulfobacteriota bacterium]
MKEFFKVTDLEEVLDYRSAFPRVTMETVTLPECSARVLAEDFISDVNLPDFSRATMDGYAVRASSTFGASEANPAYLNVIGEVTMGRAPDFSIGPGEAAQISTGGMLPDGADSVVMVEHTESIDDTTIEAYRSVAPGQNAIEVGEDFRKGEAILTCGQKLRPQETGLLAAFGRTKVDVYRQPVIGIISTGDEIIPIHEKPGMAQIRDINTYTLSSLVEKAGGIPVSFGIVRDNFDALYEQCALALTESDMVLISGGSSVGARDYTIEALSSLPDTNILVHGISISPGKPTILAKAQNKAFWGMPGHVVSSMVVFTIVVKPFLEHISGLARQNQIERRFAATLTRNVSSAQGRMEYIRIRLADKDGTLWAEPILGKSGLINTMVKADGLIEIGRNTEGLDKGTKVDVIPF